MGKSLIYNILAKNKTGKTFKDIYRDIDKLDLGLKTVKRAAGGLVIAGVAGAAAVGTTVVTSLKHFSEYETALVDMGKVTGESLESIENKIRDLPAELGTSTELVKGYYQVISAGVTDPVKAMEVLTVSARAAGAAHMEQSEVIKGITKLMAGYQGQITSASEAADLLFTIEKQGQTTFAEMIPVIGSLAAMSHNLGIHQDEMGASLAVVTQTAGSTTEAATQYQAVLTGLSKPTASMTGALNQMGYESAQSAIKQMGLVGTLQALVEWTGGSAVEMNKLFGRVEAVKGVSALATNNFTTLSGAIGQMTEKTGASERAWGAYQGTLAAVWQTAKNAIMNQVIILGQELAPQIKMIIKSVSAWIDENRDLIKSGIIEFARGFGIVLSVVWPEIREVFAWVRALIGPMDNLGRRLAYVTSGIKAMIKPLKLLWKWWNLIGKAIGWGAAKAVTSYEKVTGQFQAGTGLRGLPRTGLYYGHKGEIVLSPAASAQIRAGMRSGAERADAGRALSMRGPTSPQVIKKEVKNTFHITISPQFMTGDRNAARAVAQDLRREMIRLEQRWGVT